MGAVFYPIEDPTLHSMNQISNAIVPIISDYLANRDLYQKYSDTNLTDIVSNHNEYLKQKGYLTNDGKLNIEAIKSNIDKDQIAKTIYDIYELRTNFRDTALLNKIQMLRDANLTQIMSGSILSSEIKKYESKGKEREAMKEFLKSYGLNDEQIEKFISIDNPMLQALFIAKLVKEQEKPTEIKDDKQKGIDAGDIIKIIEKQTEGNKPEYIEKQISNGERNSIVKRNKEGDKIVKQKKPQYELDYPSGVYLKFDDLLKKFFVPKEQQEEQSLITNLLNGTPNNSKQFKRWMFKNIKDVIKYRLWEKE